MSLFQWRSLFSMKNNPLRSSDHQEEGWASIFVLGSDSTLVILLRRVVSMGLFLEMGTVFHPSSWGWLVLPPGVWGPRPPMPPPILPPPPPPPPSFLDKSCCWTLICSLCSSISASLWIWSIVFGPWSPLRGTQLFCESKCSELGLTCFYAEPASFQWHFHCCKNKGTVTGISCRDEISIYPSEVYDILQHEADSRWSLSLFDDFVHLIEILIHTRLNRTERKARFNKRWPRNISDERGLLCRAVSSDPRSHH